MSGDSDVEPIEQTFVGTGITDSAIRVDVGLLDKLMNLVGELVLCRNQILEFANSQSDSAIVDTSQRLNLVTTELQEDIMKTRMQPIRTIWSKFPRVVRDLALSLGKQVRLEMDGEETELDKTLIEAIADPLTHLVRNCVDHGIESPEDRLAVGKAAEGALMLRAAHESGYVSIEIADNGNGIDPSVIKAKALTQNLVTVAEAERMSDQDILNLIFIPGFSTATTVTNVSGRGIGMDVVRTNIEKIGGSIEVYSQLQQGTTFKLKIPLTLAIIPTLIVTTGGERYAIPQANLLELVRLEGNDALSGVEMVHSAPVHRLRGNLLPLVYLSQELHLKDSGPLTYVLNHHEGAEPPGLEDIEDLVLNIIVLQSGDKAFGLVVDGINDTQEIVVKPLGKQLKNISCYAGATIMGDGKVALILDVQGLAQRAHLIAEDSQEAVRTLDSPDLLEDRGDRQTLLICEGPNQRRMALPLSGVARLEQFARAKVERVGHQRVVQYRDQILPLVSLAEMLDHSPSATAVSSDDEPLQVVVISHSTQDPVDITSDLSARHGSRWDHDVGVIVEHIEDIIVAQLDIRGPSSQAGIDYCAVVEGKVTEVLDINALADGVEGWTSQPIVAV